MEVSVPATDDVVPTVPMLTMCPIVLVEADETDRVQMGAQASMVPMNLKQAASMMRMELLVP